ncbi:MAG: PRC-barrel domain-containing protein [Pseudobdellovibrio sp.]
MLINSKKLKGYKLLHRQGEFGTVKEFYFDDYYWTVRYLIADTGTWLFGRKVLISPYSLREIIEDTKDIKVNLTKKQIEDSPSLDYDKPVSRQFEEAYLSYYGFPEYWYGPFMWGVYPYITHSPDEWRKEFKHTQYKSWDPHLRSTSEVEGYPLEATDGEIGHVNDFIIDSDNWAIRYLVADTKNWFGGKKVLISPQWIENISWPEKKVYVNLTREAILHSAEYNEKTLITRAYENKLYESYGRKGYWNNEPRPSK